MINKLNVRTIDDIHEEKEDLTKDPSDSNFLRAESGNKVILIEYYFLKNKIVRI